MKEKLMYQGREIIMEIVPDEDIPWCCDCVCYTEEFECGLNVIREYRDEYDCTRLSGRDVIFKFKEEK